MTAYLAGIAALRISEHERAADIDVVARMVFVMMATFATEGDTPECYAAWSTIAERAGIARSTLALALDRLHHVGVIEPSGKRGKTVRWRLPLLYPGAGHKRTAGNSPGAGHKGTGDERNSPGAGHKNSPGAGHKNSPGAGHNPSESSGVHTEDDDRRANARSAGAPHAARDGKDNSRHVDRKTLALVMERRGCSEPEAQEWVADRLSKSTGPVRNVAAYVRATLDGPGPADATPSWLDDPDLDDELKPFEFEDEEDD